MLEAYQDGDASATTKIRTPEGTVAAVDLVDCAPEYEVLKHALLGNVFLFLNPEKEVEISQRVVCNLGRSLLWKWSMVEWWINWFVRGEEIRSSTEFGNLACSD